MDCHVFMEFNDTLKQCSNSCLEDVDCPAGWYCRTGPMQAEGWCLEAGCNCTPDADRPCLTADDCLQYGSGFVCLADPNGTGHNLCSMQCSVHSDCPLGYHCPVNPIDPGNPMCRCDAPDITGP